MKKIKDTDVNKKLQSLAGPFNPQLQADAKRLQDEAMTTVMDGRLMSPQYLEVPCNVTDPNSSLAIKLDAKTNPGKHFKREPKKIIHQ
jgi:hypothetical protein